LTRGRLQPFADRLLAWWDRHGRHDLPWQHPRTPYRVWVSEIMLQQTQVVTVIPYFERFVQRFPDLPALAEAPLDEVLAAWSGLGYYARARNLHAAAQRCVERHGGELPDTPEALAELPGIGLSTANAIVSQAFDRPLPILDGNARRVLARHAAVPGWPGKPAVTALLWHEAEARLPSNRGADYTQAVMDLGAGLCTRTDPGCGECPVAGDCRALALGEVALFPEPKPASKIRAQNVFMLLARRADGAVLLERRPPAGIWGGLWCLPESVSAEMLAARFGLAADGLEPQPEITHRLTHRLLRIRPLTANAQPDPRFLAEDNLAWQPKLAWEELGLPKPVLDLLRALVP